MLTHKLHCYSLGVKSRTLPQSTTFYPRKGRGTTRGKPKLVHEGHSYSYHKQRTNGYILWRCDANNKAAREKGISCNATALTTGDLPTSTLEWSRPHSHAPDSGKIGAISVRESMKTDAVISTLMPHKIVADGLLDTSRDVQYKLPPKKSLKRMIQKTRKKQAVIANPQLALACDRSLISLYIPVDLLQSWKYSRLRVWYGSNSHADY